MAPKNKGENGTRSNRIRFVMLEADLSDGNLTELTHAITSALKPSTAPVRHLPARPSPPAVLASSETTTGVEEAEDVSTVEAETAQNEEETAPPRSAKSKSKPPLPKYLHDLDVTGNGISFKDYAAEKAPKKSGKRYLTSALWLKEQGSSPTINTDKVYTLYKTAGWPLGITDWDATFRSLVQSDKMRRVESGEYAITPLGEAAVQEKTED